MTSKRRRASPSSNGSSPAPRSRSSSVEFPSPPKRRLTLPEVEETDEDLPRLLSETEYTNNDGTEELPMRWLTNFIIFDQQTQTPLSLFELDREPDDSDMNVDYVFRATGTVTPDLADEEDEELNDIDALEIDSDPDSHTPDQLGSVRVRLSVIWYIHVGYESKIYLRTEFAWYILGTPSPAYASLYGPYWIRHRLLSLVCNAIDESRNDLGERMDYPTFIKSLEVTETCPDDIVEAMQIIGRPLIEADVVREKAHIIEDIHYFGEHMGLKFDRQHPLYTVLRSLPLKEPASASIQAPVQSVETRPRRQDLQPRIADITIRRHIGRSQRINQEKEVLKHRNPTFVTRMVGRNAQRLFDQVLKSANQYKYSAKHTDVEDTFGYAGVLDSDPTWKGPELMSPTEIERFARRRKVSWKGKSIMDHTSQQPRKYYTGVKVGDGNVLVGDYVMVPAGVMKDRSESESMLRQASSQSSNTLGNTRWFGEVIQLYDESQKKGNSKIMHIRWLVHASKTILQEAHHPRELFATYDCDLLPVDLIQGACDVRRLGPGDTVPQYSVSCPENIFFLRRRWNDRTSSFHNLDPEVDVPWDGPRTCICCALDDEDKRSAIPRVVGQTLHLRGETYHRHDHVYLMSTPGSLFDIAQVTDVRSASMVKCKLYERCSSNGKDTRQLRLINQPVNISTSLLAQKCTVVHTTALPKDPSDEFGQDPDLFHVESSLRRANDSDQKPLFAEDLKSCKICFDEWEKRRALRSNPSLRMMDVFCGGGGMSQSFVRAGAASVEWGIDFSPSACETFRKQHPNAEVYNQCVNRILEHQTDPKGRRRPLYSVGNQKNPLPAFPKKGDVDLVSLTPPCTGFSGLNRFRKASDVRNTLIAPGLSFVELLQPKYVLIENVLNMARFPLRGKDTGNGTVGGGIKWGTHLFILRTLLDLDYQVRFAVLQAGAYGLPQARHRIVYIAAKTGTPLPDFPLPTHQFPVHAPSVKLPTLNVAPTVTRECVPHRQIVAKDALLDLPGFHWEDPSGKSQVPDGPDLRVFAPRSGQCGFAKATDYSSEPLSDYEAWLRVGSREVTHHSTGVYGDRTMARVCNIPLHQNADHRALHRSLELPSYVGTIGAAARNRMYAGSFGRVDLDGTFQTVVTVVNPSNRQGRCLHPTQMRVLTVREWARAQGFEDSTKFISVQNSQDDRYRIIGNAVPIPLGMALARQFLYNDR